MSDRFVANSWQLSFVSHKFCYTMQAGSNLVSIKRRGDPSESERLVAIEELEELVTEFRRCQSFLDASSG